MDWFLKCVTDIKMKQTLQNLTSYNLWANKRMIGMLRENEPRIDQVVKSSFPTLRKTLHHIWGAEELWYKRLHGESLPYIPAWDFEGSFEEAEVRFIAVSKLIQDLITQKDEKFLMQSCSYNDTRGNAHINTHWEMIMHCMNHSTYHRGQVVTMLRETGVVKIIGTDLILYFREKEAKGPSN